MNHHLRRTAGLLSLVAVLTLGVVAPTTAASPAGPIRKMALGVSMVPWTDLDKLDQFAADTGRMPAIWSVWVSWGGTNKAFPTSLVEDLDARDITPMIIWEPSNPSNTLDYSYRYERIINGKYDAYIRSFAEAAAAYGKPVLLRWAHEANGTWFPWSTKRSTNTPARFKAAWKRIWNIFKGPGGAGATNVRFLWSPNQPCGNCDTMASIYPGHTYVDFMGFSAFNWSQPQPWRSMVTTFTPAMTRLAEISSKKVIVTETASHYIGGNKATWITKGYPAVYAKWPRIKAIVYFNYNGLQEAVPKRDWRLTTPDDAPLLAYKAILTDPRFHGAIN